MDCLQGEFVQMGMSGPKKVQPTYKDLERFNDAGWSAVYQFYGRRVGL